MLRPACLAAAALALSACASDVSLSDRLAGRDRVQGDGDRVRITGMASRLEALPLAVGHCAKFRRAAQFAARTPTGYVFRCVES